MTLTPSVAAEPSRPRWNRSAKPVATSATKAATKPAANKATESAAKAAKKPKDPSTPKAGAERATTAARATSERPTIRSRRTRRSAQRRALRGLHALPAPEALREQADDTGETIRRKHRALYTLYVASGVVASIVALVVWVFPTKTWMSQNDATAAASGKLRVLDEQIAALEQQVVALDTDAEIVRVARERYGLVYPGEKAYVVLPATPPNLPNLTGYNVVRSYFTDLG
ncbi:MAG: septum formation initiator family protein [Acidimicrobiia bacterium]